MDVRNLRIAIHRCLHNIYSKVKVATNKMLNLFSSVTLILMMIALPTCFVTAAPVRIGRQTDISEPQARKTLREGLIVLWNAAVSLLITKRFTIHCYAIFTLI